MSAGLSNKGGAVIESGSLISYRIRLVIFVGLNFRGLGSSDDFVGLYFRGVSPLIT